MASDVGSLNCHVNSVNKSHDRFNGRPSPGLVPPLRMIRTVIPATPAEVRYRARSATWHPASRFSNFRAASYVFDNPATFTDPRHAEFAAGESHATL